MLALLLARLLFRGDMTKMEIKIDGTPHIINNDDIFKISAYVFLCNVVITVGVYAIIALIYVTWWAFV